MFFFIYPKTHKTWTIIDATNFSLVVSTRLHISKRNNPHCLLKFLRSSVQDQSTFDITMANFFWQDVLHENLLNNFLDRWHCEFTRTTVRIFIDFFWTSTPTYREIIWSAINNFHCFVALHDNCDLIVFKFLIMIKNSERDDCWKKNQILSNVETISYLVTLKSSQCIKSVSRSTSIFLSRFKISIFGI